MPDQRDVAHRNRPRLGQRRQQFVERMPVAGDVQSGVVPHVHGGEAQIVAEPGAVGARIGSVDGRARGSAPRRFGLAQPVDEYDEAVGRVGERLGERRGRRVDGAPVHPHGHGRGQRIAAGGEFVTVDAVERGDRLRDGRGPVDRGVVVEARRREDTDRLGHALAGGADRGVDRLGDDVVDHLDRAGGGADGGEHPARDAGVHTPDDVVQDGDSLGGDFAESPDLSGAHGPVYPDRGAGHGRSPAGSAPGR